MAYQAVFKRYELKYILTRQQQRQLLRVMQPYMEQDGYGHTVIRNLYFDTDTYRLARRSMEKPVYKEKLRVRSYGRAGQDSQVFVELKKKYDSVVYKRRIAMPQQEALAWLCGGIRTAMQTQIAEEIDYFRAYYKTLHPAVFLSYERDAYYSRSGDEFRVTFDTNIISRETGLSLEEDIWGTPLLKPDEVLLELKTAGSIPLWMTRFLTQNRIYRTSFSKYGEAYRKRMTEKQTGGQLYA